MSLTIVPLLFLSGLATKSRSLSAFYDSLRDCPVLPRNPSPIDYASHSLRKAYFQYLVTSSGYMLGSFERLLLDLFVATLAAVLVWCAVVVSPAVVRVSSVLLGTGVLSGKEVGVVGGAGEVVVAGWSGNVSLRVVGSTGVFGGVGWVKNGTA